MKQSYEKHKILNEKDENDFLFYKLELFLFLLDSNNWIKQQPKIYQVNKLIHLKTLPLLFNPRANFTANNYYFLL